MNEETTTIERPRYAVRKGIEAVKEAVPILDYLHDQGVEVRHNRSRCLVHGGDNPTSFAVYPDEGRWHCFRCNEGGDVVDLCRAVEGGEVWEAMVSLAQRFNVALPNTRTDTWRSWQGDKTAIREGLRRALTKVYQRRFYRMLRDPGAHPDDDEALWVELYNPAYLAATKRVMG